MSSFEGTFFFFFLLKENRFAMLGVRFQTRAPPQSLRQVFSERGVRGRQPLQGSAQARQGSVRARPGGAGAGEVCAQAGQRSDTWTVIWHFFERLAFFVAWVKS